MQASLQNAAACAGGIHSVTNTGEVPILVPQMAPGGTVLRETTMALEQTLLHSISEVCEVSEMENRTVAGEWGLQLLLISCRA